MNAWIMLTIAGLCEIVGAHGFHRLALRQYAIGTGLAVVGFGLALAALHTAMHAIAPSIAYALFSGIGTLGSVLAAWLVFNERPTRIAAIWLVVVIVALIGLRLSAGAST